MTHTLSLTPTGRLFLSALDHKESAPAAPWMKAVATAFAADQSAGLFALAAKQPDVTLEPSVAYWREFSSLYLRNLCQAAEPSPREVTSGQSVALPAPVTDLEKLLASVPPMRGAEYLNIEILTDFWSELDDWVNNAVSSSADSLSSWLQKHAPIWHQVGRVCFHLAESKRDPEYPFAFLATYAPGVSSGGRVQYQPLSQALKEYAGERNKQALINLLSPVQLAAEKSEFIKELVASNDIFHPLMWTPEEAYRLLKEVALLEQSGLLVRLPNWWRKRARPTVAVTIGENKVNRLGLDAMLDFSVELVLGDIKLSKAELKQILNSPEDGLVYIKGQWVEVDRERLEEALAHWKKVEKEAASGLTFIEGMRLLAGATADLDGSSSSSSSSNSNSNSNTDDSQWSTVNAGSWLSDVLTNLRTPKNRKSDNLSKSFKGTLRPYQKAGHDWLLFLTDLGLGACLADDMGLGKTVQIIALLLSVKEAGKQPPRPSLLVLPASLLSNWHSELQRFAPSLKVCFVHPSQNSAEELTAMAKEPATTIGGADLVLTTYGMLLRQKWLLDIPWRLAILDEAQAIKNPGANQTRAVKKLKSEARIVLTGTPVENRLSDLWSLFDFLLPGLLGTVTRFKLFIKNLEAREQQRYAPLRNLVSPYILRRLKTDKSIISDLPDKTEMSVFCGLTKEQAALYARSVQELKRALEEAKKDGNGIQRRGLVLSFLLRFKQICNHPSQLLGNGIYDPADSGKFDRLKTICEEIASRQEKVLVFTQYREMTAPINSFLEEIFGRSGLVLHGGTAVSKRKDIVDTFQQADGPPFIVLTVKAGGTGLNLTAASHVIHFDRWWNPAVENQATDRAYRIGQNRNVLVHKFICLGTIEEKIDLLITEKKELADGILSAGGAESMLTEMSDSELLNLVSLDLDRINIES